MDSVNFFSSDVNWLKITEELESYPWDKELSLDSHSTMISKFTDICYNICKRFVPLKKPKSLRNRLQIPTNRRILITQQLRRKHISNRRRTSLKEELVQIELSLQTDYCTEKAIQEEHAVSTIKKNCKYFFSYAKKFAKTYLGIGPLTGPNSKIVNWVAM